MTAEPSGLQRLATLFDEAAQLHGDNWQAVSDHVREAVSRLPEETRDQLACEVDRLLRFRPPWQAQNGPH